MKHLLILLAALCSLQVSFAQEPSTPSSKRFLTEMDFLRAISLYRKMSLSETYKENTNLGRDFVDHMPTNNSSWINLEDDEFEKWISENLSITTFKTAEEAIAMNQKWLVVLQKLMDENREVYDLINHASLEQIIEITKPDMERSW